MILAVEWMVWKYGIERVGVLTLSFGVPGSGKGSFETWVLRQQAKVWGFVQKRWHSFCTHVIADRYADWVCVFELHRDRVAFYIGTYISSQTERRAPEDKGMRSVCYSLKIRRHHQAFQFTAGGNAKWRLGCKNLPGKLPALGA